MGCGLAGDGLMGGDRVSDGLASRNQRYRVLRLMWWCWAIAASEAPGCLHVSTMWALNAWLYWRRCVRGGVRARVSMVSACCEVDTIFRLWLSGLKVAGTEAYVNQPLRHGLQPRFISLSSLHFALHQAAHISGHFFVTDGFSRLKSHAIEVNAGVF